MIAMDYKLVVVAGDAKQKVIKIKPPTIIGRSRDADVPVGHALVSRRHCEITVSDDGTLIVEDLGSLNGTYHGDQRISEPVYLEPGDMLTVGSITFQAQYGSFKADNDPPSVSKAAAKSKAPVADEDGFPDFMSEEGEEEEPEVDEADADVEEMMSEEPAENEPAEEDLVEEETEAPVEPANKKRRPPPPVIESNTEEEDIADMLELPEDEDDVEAEEEFEDEPEDEGDFDVEAALDGAGDSDGDSNIPVGEDDDSESADVEEEEVEVAAGDSRSGDSGSGMSWLTGDEEEDKEGSGKSSESGLDDFFKSL